MSTLQINFNKLINQKFLFEKNPVIAVAVSGGPDSIALVFLLQKWIKEKKGKLCALIVDHQIRKNSTAEAYYVKKYLHLYNIQSRILKISKKNIFKGTMSQAREYRFLKMTNFCKKNQIFHLFLGHHYNDNIETFVLRKIAGSNFEGLNCMQEKIIFKNIQILRPLLNFSKNDILKYVKKINLKYIQDPSNKNEKYSRVIIRNFLSKNKNFFYEAKKDFNLVRNNHAHYKSMLFQIFNLINLKIKKNTIIFNKTKFINLDKELQTKFIEISYKFLNSRSPFLRYKKIVSVTKTLQKKTDLSITVAKMRINNCGNLIHFST